jgi:DNA-binding response OmpR family regulator
MAAKLKVLVIEHEIPVAMQMAAAFTQAGCSVKIAHTGKKGMALATVKRFDLVVLDANLPDINGFEICDDLKQRHISKHTPVIFISSKPSKEDRQRGFDLGAVDYIAKPFVEVDLVSRLLSHLNSKMTYA